jgi:hypothetical protein
VEADDSHLKETLTSQFMTKFVKLSEVIFLFIFIQFLNKITSESLFPRSDIGLATFVKIREYIWMNYQAFIFAVFIKIHSFFFQDELSGIKQQLLHLMMHIHQELPCLWIHLGHVPLLPEWSFRHLRR